MKEKRWKLETEDYGRFLDLFWKGEYVEAEKVGKAMVRDEEQTFGQRTGSKLKRVLKKKTSP